MIKSLIVVIYSNTQYHHKFISCSAIDSSQVKYGRFFSPSFSALLIVWVVGATGVINLNVFSAAFESAITLRGHHSPLLGGSSFFWLLE